MSRIGLVLEPDPSCFNGTKPCNVSGHIYHIFGDFLGRNKKNVRSHINHIFREVDHSGWVVVGGEWLIASGMWD